MVNVLKPRDVILTSRLFTMRHALIEINLMRSGPVEYTECQIPLHNYLLGPTFRHRHLSTKIDDIVGQKHLFYQHGHAQIVHHIRTVPARNCLGYSCIEQHCFSN